MIRKPNAYLVMMGDIVQSRATERLGRARLQKRFVEQIARTNRKYRGALATQLAVVLGDEFQGVLKEAAVIPDIIWDFEADLPEVEIRLGFGYGAIYTPFEKRSLKMDGPAFHLAREAVNLARESGRLGGMFQGFGSSTYLLNGLAHLLWFHRDDWTKKQRRIVNALRLGQSQASIAKSEGFSPQNTSSQVRASGADIYFEAEDSFRELLRSFNSKGPAR